ncbi:HlyD family type I secretion periplasmic adaptor subunit [Mesorhizobium sp. NZP2234]|uniref:HlyD family type I secretion periplasmic adaptor subunit n=1 Tax=Mesorhizobium sp. NZP2234 TaxID=2483402 RepID=UPI001555BB5A|nr:HlyD family type I secretion periplasmic adaptor subunit [Mesorhizobium sp. NZP2234]QKC90607.1 HlyD family type I secretion periplasmic adaptor subunit [Mesorhizobium sp. NZP2234]
MGRYWNAIREGVAREAGTKRPALNRHEREFQAAAIEILETPASPAARIFAALIMVFASGALAWSWFGRIDTYATVQGKLIPLGKVQVIEPLITGTVKALHARLGAHVEAGDVLVELDPSEYAAERQKLSGNLEAAEVSEARLEALVDAVAQETPSAQASFTAPEGAAPDVVALQLQQMRQSLAAYQAEQASLEAAIAQKQVEIERGNRTLAERRRLVSLAGDRLEVYEQLERRQVGIRTSTIEARQGQQDQLMAAVDGEGQVAELEATMRTLAAQKRERREAYLDKVNTELIEVDRTIGGLQQDLAKAELFERSSVLKSPVAGRVQQLEVNTLGEVVQTGQRLMVIVPDGTKLEIEAMLLNRDKGFVHEGQEARVKIEAFPFTRYGTLDGKVLTVSNDAIPAGASQQAPGAKQEAAHDAAGPLVFPVRIALNETSIRVEGQDVLLTPGMSVTAEAKTGDRRVLEFLLDPLIEMTDEAFHER